MVQKPLTLPIHVCNHCCPWTLVGNLPNATNAFDLPDCTGNEDMASAGRIDNGSGKCSFSVKDMPLQRQDTREAVRAGLKL